MNEALQKARKFCGRFSGTGTNHANEQFIGDFELAELLDGKGFQIKFLARSEKNSAVIYHSEVSLLAPNSTGGLSLFNLNTNIPFLTEHTLVASQSSASGSDLTFRFGKLEDQNSFREEIRLEFLNDERVGYHYSWGMPGASFEYRSGVVMGSV